MSRLVGGSDRPAVDHNGSSRAIIIGMTVRTIDIPGQVMSDIDIESLSSIWIITMAYAPCPGMGISCQVHDRHFIRMTFSAEIQSICLVRI